MLRSALWLVLILVLGVPPEAASQTAHPTPPPGSPAFQQGLYLQVTADAQRSRTFAGENGFRVSQARLRLYGTLPGDVQWALSSNMEVLADARMSVPAGPGVRVEGGFMKPPFSAEYQAASSALDFMERAQGIRSLIQQRQVGVLVSARAGQVFFRTGIYNGNGFDPAGDDDGGKQWFARGEWDPRAPFDSLHFGVSWMRNSAEETLEGDGILTRFASLPGAVGGDVRVVSGRWFVYGEGIVGRRSEAGHPDPWGVQGTLGFRGPRTLGVVARVDHYEAGEAIADPSTLLILGVSRRPTALTRVLSEVTLPLAGPHRGPRLQGRMQIYF